MTEKQLEKTPEMPMPFEEAPWQQEVPEVGERDPEHGMGFDPTDEQLAKSQALQEYVSYEGETAEMNPSMRKMLIRALEQDIAQAEEAHDLDLKSSLMWAHSHLLEHEKTDLAEDPLGEQEDITEWMEEEGSASGGEEGTGSRQGPPMESFKGLEPEGLAPGDVSGGDFEGRTITEDRLDKLLRDPATRARIQEKLRRL